MTTSRGADPSDLTVGQAVELDIGAVAHGGVCVARAAGRVVFVRYALPGERAVVRITEVRPGSFCRGDAVEILRADPRRVVAPCAHFGPGGCGGCDFQHATGDLQRELKAQVVREQLARLAGIDLPVVVEPLPGGGFGWRSRVRWAIAQADGGAGRSVVIGPRRYRSHEPVPISRERPCLIAESELSTAAAGLDPPAGCGEVVLVRRPGAPPAVNYLARDRRTPVRRSRSHDLLAVGSGAAGSPGPAGTGAALVERAYDRDFAVAADGFWQPHEAAATVLSGAVDEALASVDLAGAMSWDLYGGVGLFAAVLADLAGPSGSVVTVEADRAAADLAARNLADLPRVRAVADRVDRFLRTEAGSPTAVVLDPPRSGAGQAVCRDLAQRGPAILVYVACDPAALARDAAALGAGGYRLSALRAFDTFPQTHHVECVASFVPA